jgi:isopenicillin-N epimerase
MPVDPGRKERRSQWTLDPNVTFLNHGSFGACPTIVRDKQRAIQDQLEREPVAFFLEAYPQLLAQTKVSVAQFLDAPSEGIAMVRNTTEGVNAILSSIDWQPDDEILVTNHTYPACAKAAHYARAVHGVKVRTLIIDPEWTDDEVLTAFKAALSHRTRLALMDHITSATGLVLPAAGFVNACRHAGVLSLIDGAHAPGMLDLSMTQLQPDFYVGNLHKWCCAPKGSAFVYAAESKRTTLTPTSISHGYQVDKNEQDLAALFDWPGTFDPSAWLTVPTALEFITNLHPEGLSALRQESIALRERAETLIGDQLPMLSSRQGNLSWMRTFRLPPSTEPQAGPLEIDPFQRMLNRKHGIQVPVTYWPSYPQRVMRISVAPYNTFTEYETLANALPDVLGAVDVSRQ